ncbi:MAG: hypothetical protein O7D33_02530 [Chloroflexi bacterium]|nr:hypothetical protein [Chloroflexota bacterium]
MARDPLWRIRLKHEDSLGRCDLCERQGIVGADIKLVTPAEGGPPPREEQDTTFMLRCADPAACRQRREDRQRDD